MSYTETNIFSDNDIGKKVKFYLDDGSLFTGIITSFPNEEHVSVLVDHAWTGWSWYVRNEAVLFV
jgi:hypothetical protein